jgi:aspartyl-tRNA(Asn)/glutamyl-tRNA(Gln) amidotransferase subunit C
MKVLSSEEVIHIAKLANLNLSEKDLKLFSDQLTEILLYVEKLNSVDTDKVEPLSNVIEKKNVFRQDEVKDSLTQEECLRNAPSTHNGYFKVKSIF